jgi:hypothetical protein
VNWPAVSRPGFTVDCCSRQPKSVYRCQTCDAWLCCIHPGRCPVCKRDGITEPTADTRRALEREGL